MAPKKMYSRLKKQKHLQDSTTFMMVLHAKYCHVLFSINTQPLELHQQFKAILLGIFVCETPDFADSNHQCCGFRMNE